MARVLSTRPLCPRNSLPSEFAPGSHHARVRRLTASQGNDVQLFLTFNTSQWSGGLSGSAYLHAAHVGPEHLRDDYRAVGLLVVLEDGDHRPRQGDAGTVERVRIVSFAASIAAKANIGPPRLVVIGIRNRRHFEPLARAGRPRVQVIRLGHREAKVTRAQRQHLVWQLEPSQHFFRVSNSSSRCCIDSSGSTTRTISTL